MIRSYRPQDADDVLSIWHEASALAHPFLDAAFLEKAKTLIRGTLLDMAETWISIAPDGRPVGFISLLENEVGGLFVRPAFHGTGRGRALMDHAVAARGNLTLEVFTANAPGRRFYQRYGFVEGPEHQDEMSGHPVLRLHYPA